MSKKYYVEPTTETVEVEAGQQLLDTSMPVDRESDPVDAELLLSRDAVESLVDQVFLFGD